MVPDMRRWWTKKTFWAAVTAILGVIGTAWAFAIDASPYAKAAFATVTGIAAVLEGVFVADRVSRVSGGKNLLLLFGLAGVLALAGCTTLQPRHATIHVLRTKPVREHPPAAWPDTTRALTDITKFGLTALTGCKLCAAVLIAEAIGLSGGGMMTELARQAGSAEIHGERIAIPLEPGQGIVIEIDRNGTRALFSPPPRRE